MDVDLLSLLLTAAVLVISYLVITWGIKGYRYVSLINRIPGPPAYPLIGNALDVVMAPRNRFMDVINRNSTTYTPIYRIWVGVLPIIHLMKPEHIEIVLSGVKHSQKGIAYKFLHPWLGDGLLTSFGAKWQAHRKMITPTFHFKILEAFFIVFVEKSQVMVNKLRDQVLANPGDKGINLYPFISRCTLDIICETAMGVELNAQEETESEYVQAVLDISELTLRRATRPWLHNNFIFSKSHDGRRYNHCLKVLHGFTNKVIQERKEDFLKSSKQDYSTLTEDIDIGTKKRLAFLDLLLQETTKGSSLTDREIREEVDTFMFEGHDTTTAGIAWALLLLGVHPDVQEKVIEELDEIFQNSDRPITMRDIQEMKYLERVIKETLRLYPSVPFIMRTLEEDTQFGQYTVPSGCMVNVHIYHAHRDPEHFMNPEEFNPDNFLPERAQGRHPYAYVPFSAGPRNCIGQKFALLEEKTLLASILRNFRVRSLEKREDIILLNELVLRPEAGVKAVLTPR